MKKLFSILVVLIFICAVFMATVQAESLTGQSENEPGITISMSPIFTTLKVPAKVPDPALKAALHSAAGVPQSETLYKVDLLKIKGTLVLDNLGIQDITGIHDCKEIDVLSLKNNQITELDNMKTMHGLDKLYLDGNNFTAVPHEYRIPNNLQVLSMSGNPITTVHEDIKQKGYLEELDISNCAFTAFPEALTASTIRKLDISNNNIGELPESIIDMSLSNLYADNCGLTGIVDEVYGIVGLGVLSLADNNISDISKSITNLEWLISLNLSNNNLTLLPSEMSSMHRLEHLIVDNNDLTALPLHIGQAPLTYLSARNNQITNFPASLCFSTKIDTLDLMLNRITSLPPNFNQSSFSYLSIPFNYLDITEGSQTHALLDGASGTIKYVPQIEPPMGLTAAATHNSVTISWQPCPTGMYASGALHVEGYTVYHTNGSTTKLAELSNDKTTFMLTGLSPETSHTFRVIVDYWIEHESHNINEYRSAEAQVSATTMPAPTPSPENMAIDAAGGTAEAAAVDTQQDTPSGEVAAPSASDAAAAGAAGATQANTGFPIWAIILICVLGAAGLGTGIVFVILARRKRDKTQKADSAK